MKNKTEQQVEIPTGKFKITSKLSGGQQVYFINEGKIGTGIITGFSAAIVSKRSYAVNNNRYEVSTNSGYEFVNEQDCYTSQRALLIGIKK